MSYCTEQNHVHYNPYDYSDRYLTFIAREDGATFTFNGTTVNDVLNKASYSTDNGNTWTEIASGVSTPSIDSGDRILWKGEMTPNPSNYQGIGTFTATKNFDVEGNAMSLLFGDDFIGQTSLEGKDMAFRQLFNGNTNVVSAENLSLPATTLANYCYQMMFRGCTSLVSVPQLPATTLANWCYAHMFGACTSLTTAPSVLPATTLADDCYSSMFQGCTSLTTAPELPATTLADSCYYGMFRGCTNLATAPELPATTLAQNCYQAMFSDCTSLTTAPELPATTLANDCYCEMFSGCTSLTTAPELPATTLADSCYYGMFSGCTSLTTAPELPATTLITSCYYYMFDGCANLNYIKAMFTTTPLWTYTENWVRGVSATGTFVKNSASELDVSGFYGIPNGWTVETASA